jgi:hypothetical protein
MAIPFAFIFLSAIWQVYDHGFVGGLTDMLAWCRSYPLLSLFLIIYCSLWVYFSADREPSPVSQLKPRSSTMNFSVEADSWRQHPRDTSQNRTVSTTDNSSSADDATSPVYVYLMINKRNSLYKIGRSTSPQYREKTLQSEEPEVHLLWKLLARKEDEVHLHQLFKTSRVRGEWFDLEPEEVEWIRSAQTRSDLYRENGF